jgi:hypothetical protein
MDFLRSPYAGLPKVVSLLPEWTPTTCFVQASCDYGRIKNACQNKLHFSFVSILKATRGYEDEEFQSCGGAD